MPDRLVIVDGYNVILRAPSMRPGKDRTLREARDKLVNMLSWVVGSEDSRFIVVFDGSHAAGPPEKSARVEVRYSRAPATADDVIHDLVEASVDNEEHVTVVTADIEVARHARAMGADIALSDLFLASILGRVSDKADETPEKPSALSKKEVEEWAELFKRRMREGDTSD